jgi:hypothetical protein
MQLSIIAPVWYQFHAVGMAYYAVFEARRLLNDVYSGDSDPGYADSYP